MLTSVAPALSTKCELGFAKHLLTTLYTGMDVGVGGHRGHMPPTFKDLLKVPFHVTEFPYLKGFQSGFEGAKNSQNTRF